MTGREPAADAALRASGADAARREAWQLMGAAVLRFNTGKQEVAEKLGMSFGRAKALRRVNSHGPLPMRELVSLLASDAANVTVVVDDLESRGLVTRSPHPTDRRAKIVSVTPAGARAARKADAILARPPEGMSRLSDAEVATLRELLSRVLGEDAMEQLARA